LDRPFAIQAHHQGPKIPAVRDRSSCGTGRQAILGHYGVTETERYAHLAAGFWAEGVHQALALDLSPAAELVSLENAQKMPSDRDKHRATSLTHK